MKSFQFSFEAIGTAWVIDIFDSISLQQQQAIIALVKQRIEEYDKVYSRFRPDSIVSAMAKKEGEYTLPKDSKELMTMYKKLYTITDGYFTPLIGQVLEDIGYDATYSLKPKDSIANVPSWDDVIEFHFPKIIMHKPALLDFGAAGKGHIIDLVGRAMELNGISAYCVDAGGDILYKSIAREPIRIGLEHPENEKQVIGVVSLPYGSICGSAGNRRKWDTYHHIINPKTKKSTEDILSVWVIAKKTILADALATALFFTSPETLRDHFDFEYAMLNKDYKLKKSDTFPGEIFYS
jgi:FAD:protein FMN transferase